ncbi:hypothetical protein [Marinomonas sp.]|uniref:hypothetical protein n=1 Tax=Marinomonas sp. TaxID=1904862 RepID=UPI003BA978C2
MNTIEIQLLAEQALGLTPDQADALIDSGEDYDTPLKERFGVDLETFGKIANALSNNRTTPNQTAYTYFCSIKRRT